MSIRDRILDAAARVLRDKGLVGATTKEIAREAGCSEGSLYNHFNSKEDIFLYVLRERMPNFISLMASLSQRVGQGEVRDTLKEVAVSALTFFKETGPLAGSMFSSPELLQRHRAGIRREKGGPHRANMAVAGYLRAEQRLGRINPAVEPPAAAAALLGACFQRTFLRQFLGEPLDEQTDESFVDALLDCVMPGLSV